MRIYFLVIISILFITVRRIKSYDCDSLRDHHCNEYFYPEDIQETYYDDAEMPEYLQKYGRRIATTGCLTKFYEGVDSFRYFIRHSCYFDDIKRTKEACESKDPYLPYANIVSCHVCGKDLCNTNNASMDKSSFHLTLSIILAIILNKMFN